VAIGLAFARPGVLGLATVMPVELAIIIGMSLTTRCSPPTGSNRLPATTLPAPCRAWSISSSAAIAVFTALGGLLADLGGTRTALAVAGLAASPLLLHRRLGLATPTDQDAELAEYALILAL